MLTEVIFRGIFSVLDFSFLRKLIAEAREVYYNSPEINLEITFESTIETINSNFYVDLVINTDYFYVNEETISKVFINLGRDNEEIELLFFFDLKDLNQSTQKMNLDYLRNWTKEFQKKYDFNYFICQIDNANENEYYFNIDGLGPLYYNLRR